MNPEKPRARRIWCKKCRWTILWVRERAVEIDWLFEKARIAGIPVLASEEEAECPECGIAIQTPPAHVFDEFKGGYVEIGPEQDLEVLCR